MALFSADLGRVTNNYTLVEVSNAFAINTKLNVLKETSGPLRGSQRIDERLVTMCEDLLGGEEVVEEDAMRLGTSLNAFRGRVLNSIEVAKKLFPMDPFYAITVFGPTGSQDFYTLTD